MPNENLTPDERAELLSVLRQTIAIDRFPFSRRVPYLKSALAKLDPKSEPPVEHFRRAQPSSR